MALKVAKLLEILGDGKWHKTERIQEQVNLTDCQVEEIKDFLGRYDFAKVDEGKNRVRISKDFRKIITDLAI